MVNNTAIRDEIIQKQILNSNPLKNASLSIEIDNILEQKNDICLFNQLMTKNETGIVIKQPNPNNNKTLIN
jgi:hypothetical protein